LLVVQTGGMAAVAVTFARYFVELAQLPISYALLAAIVLAALTLPLGFTTSKEYAELEWPIDLLITAVWVTFGWNLIGTVLRNNS